jgi:hypothetical protein
LKSIIPGNRFAAWSLAASLLTSAGCSEEPPPVVNEPPGVAELRAAGKKPWEIRNEMRAQAVTRALKSSSPAAHRTN